MNKPKPKPLVKPVPKPEAPKPVVANPAKVPKKIVVPHHIEKPKQASKTLYAAKKKQQLVEAPRPTPVPTPAPTPEVEEASVEQHEVEKPAVDAQQIRSEEKKTAEAHASESSPAIDPALLGPSESNPQGSGKQLAVRGGMALSSASGTGPGGGGGGGGDISQTYYQNILLKITQNFKPPQTSPAGIQCRVRFFVQSDGTITNIMKVKSTGSLFYDNYAIQALAQTDKLTPLYDSFKEDHLDLVLTFVYNNR
jgi:outer membrane biosynthesis protein TonB